MTAAGLIFSNIHDQGIPQMTQMRTMASIPFGCRYRLVDFALSNMVNSDITTVGVITHYNYQSLLDHIGTGKDWDLARRSGGIKILPPYIAAYENTAAGKLYSTRLEAMMGSVNYVNRCGADYMVLSDCDTVLNIDLTAVIEDHIASGAFATFVTKKIRPGEKTLEGVWDIMKVDEDRRIVDVARACPEGVEEVEVSTNIMVIRRSDLQAVLADSLSHGYTSFFRDILTKQIKNKVFRAYRFDGWFTRVSSLESYFAASMELLTKEAREALFGIADRQIYTKIRNSAPTKYVGESQVKNSLIADGCVVEGVVENSILFRGVHVGRGTVIRNSILLQGTYIGSNAKLNCVISDKNVVVKDDRTLSGHETMPFFIGKGMTV